MSNTESTSTTLFEQRKRFEALGRSINKGNQFSSWLNVLFAFSLIFGIPSILLLSDPLKDNTAFMYQAIAYAFRLFIIAMVLLFTSRIAPAIFAANSDFNKKLSLVGYTDKEKNTKKEIALVGKKVIYNLIMAISLTIAALGLFLLGSRANVAYIIGSQVLLLVLVICFGLTIRFWFTRKPKESPRMGGRVLVYKLLPVVFVFGIETVLQFFFILNDPNFEYNILQMTYGLAYPAVFVFILIAVLVTTKKTRREKMSFYKAKEAELERRARFISDKNAISRFFYNIESNWDIFLKKISRRDYDDSEKLDKLPSKTLVNSIWITLFITIVPLSVLIPWNFFPHDGLLMIISLIVCYEYSMLKYERYEIDAIGHLEKNIEQEPPESRTDELTNKIFVAILLPTLVFIVALPILGNIITNGDYSGFNGMIVKGFTWVAVLLVIPLSIRLFYYLKESMEEERTAHSTQLQRTSIRNLLLISIGFLIFLVIGHFLGTRFNVDFVTIDTLLLYGVIIIEILLVPYLYLIIASLIKDKEYKISQNLSLSQFNILNISTFCVFLLGNLGIFIWFIFDIIVAYFG